MNKETHLNYYATAYNGGERTITLQDKIKSNMTKTSMHP